MVAQEGLYGDPPPPNAAFVRVVQTVKDTVASDLSIGATEYNDLPFAEISPYRVVLEGSHQLKTADLEQTLNIEKGKFYTVVLGETATLLEDAISTNRAKALLSLYNLSNLEAVDLKTADGQTDVLLGVEPGELKSIEVNSITVDLAVFNGVTELANFPAVQLERTAAYSAIVVGSETVIWIQSQAITD